MVLAKNHVPLTESKLVKFTKQDMQILRRVARKKRLTVSHLIRTLIFSALEAEGELEK